MDFLKLFTRRSEEQEAREAYASMQDAIAKETPEQKTRFYLEVAALMGNQSAADILRDMKT